MKRNDILRAALMAACTLGLAWSCAKEIAPETTDKATEPAKTNPSVISAEIPEDLKVALSDEGVGNGLSMAWEAGDQIRVIATAGGSGNEVFTIQNGFTPTKASFSGTPVAGTQFTVFYPGSYANVAALNARSYATQTQIGNGNTDHLEWNAIETGLSDYTTLTFSEKMNGAIRFHLTLPASFTKAYSITLSAPSAIFSVDNADSDKTDELVLNLKSDASTDGITLGSDKVLDAFMMVSWNDNVLAAGTVLTVSVQGEESEPWTRSSTVPEGGYTIRGGKVTGISFGDQHWDEPMFFGGSGTQADPYQIKTLAHLKNMYTGSDYKGIYYIMVDDIALSSEEAAAYVEINNFYGHLDGNDHAISGLTTPLFGDFRGWVSNLDVSANVNFNGTDSRIKGVDYGIGILAHYLYNTDDTNTVSNVTTRGSLTIDGLTKSHAYQVGAIAGSSNGVPLSGCKNYADITIESVNVGSSNLRVGGLAGVLQSSTRASSQNCENHGAVTVKAVTAGAEVGIGGVFGLLTQASTVITNCDNTGAVSVNYNDIGSITWNAVGGIVGLCTGNNISILNCDNTGAVSNANSAAKAYDGNTIVAKFSTGGVGGYLQGAFTMTSCSSTGNISGVSWVGGLVGRNSNGGAQITSCKSAGTLTTMGVSAVHCIGGIAGEFVGTLQKSYSTMTIRKNTALSRAVGGLVGDAYNSSMTLIIKECYYDGTMEGASQIGGLVGHSRRNVQIQNSYSAGTITGNAGYMASIIGYVNNGASCEVTNCYSAMQVTTTASGNAIGGLIGGADTTTNTWDVSNLLAWNSSISFQTNNTTDGVVIGQIHSGASTASTSFSNCWYRNDLTYLVKGTPKDISTDSADVTEGGKKIYNGRQSASGVSCSAKAAEIGWDGTTIWNLSGSYPALRRVVE
ncbi:MAG: hypothetical protein J6Y32_04325 [Bacteroidales bacterium]|nr:hypothetical protein [Bacteroidales bacterium]